MKIIKLSSPVRRAECPNCQSVLEFEEREAKHFSYHQIDGDRLGVDCPVCGAVVWVPWSRGDQGPG